MGFLAPYQPQIYALVRIVVGFLFLCHGAQKLFAGIPPMVPPALGFAAMVIELVGGGLVMLGLFAAPAAFICSGQMAVAYFLVHQPRGLLPITNGGEPAALFAWIFLLIATQGAGIWSFDARRGRT